MTSPPRGLGSVAEVAAKPGLKKRSAPIRWPHACAFSLGLLALGGCNPAQMEQLKAGLAQATADMAAGLGTRQPLEGRVAKGANLRDGPGTNYPRVGQAAAGRSFIVTARQENWYQVAFADGAAPAAGWLRADLTELTIAEGQPRSAEATAAVNLRAAPNGDAQIVGILAAGSKVEIIGVQPGWLQVKQGELEGWASGRYVVADLPASGVGGSPSFLAGLTPGNGGAAQTQSPSVAKDPSTWTLREGSMKPLETRIETAGYTAAFRGVRAMARNGAFELALDELHKLSEPPLAEIAPAAGTESAEPIPASASKAADGDTDSQGFVGQDSLHLAIERGTLLLEKGELQAAVAAFEEAEGELGKRNQRSKFGDLFTNAASVIGGAVSGEGEFGPYNLQPYEEILFLNYKTIGYLLQGKREAYNVSRRATNRQNELRDEFVELIEQVKGEPPVPKDEEERAEEADQIEQVDNWLHEIGKRYDGAGDRVPSAYVNPFGFYVVGMVNEIESYVDPSLRDNARIAYSKALELNPSSPVLKEAVVAMKNSFARSDRKIVHVVGSIGMAPEKRVASFGLPITKLQTVLPLKFPVYQEVPDVVARIEVRDITGQRLLGKLSPLADIEAMALRYQKDRLPAETGRFLLGLYPRLFERSMWSKFGSVGKAIADWREGSINPDMRAWLALPATFHAARLELPKKASRIQIRSFDAKGRELGRKTIDLPGDNHSFAYVRAVEKVLTAQAGEASWVEH